MFSSKISVEDEEVESLLGEERVVSPASTNFCSPPVNSVEKVAMASTSYLLSVVYVLSLVLTAALFLTFGLYIGDKKSDSNLRTLVGAKSQFEAESKLRHRAELALGAAEARAREAETSLSALRTECKGGVVDEDHFFAGLESQDPFSANVTGEDSLMLRSYTYSNCPFTLAKFSQWQMANKKGPFTSEEDKKLNSILRAEMGMQFSNDARAYERVYKALEENAFNRRIVLDGDSLTRQLLISLGCLAWSAGHVAYYNTSELKFYPGGGLKAFRSNPNYNASSWLFDQAYIRLKGGGEIYYINNKLTNRGGATLKSATEPMIHQACDEEVKPYEARIDYEKPWLPMKKGDVVVVGAGHHPERPKYVSAYKQFFECQNNTNSTSKKKAFAEWPYFLYQLSSLEAFWTEDGYYGSKRIAGTKGRSSLSCQTNIKSTQRRKIDRKKLNGLVPFIADDIDMKNLGDYHAWHGDCLHWLQPGVPDIFAAQLADFLSNNV